MKSIYNQSYLLLILTFALSSCSLSDNDKKEGIIEPLEPPVMRGVDLSFLPLIEQHNIQFNQSDSSALVLFKKNGFNTVRLRLWHDADEDYMLEDEVLDVAKQAKALGFKLMLTVHYSDTWADPGAQTKPKAWQNLTFDALADSVTQYTARICRTFEPDMIQIGNEINNGFLWPTGNRWEQPQQFVQLLDAASSGVRLVSSSCGIIVHFAGTENLNEFMEQVSSVNYDILGMSYYPWWHGKDLQKLNESFDLIESYDKTASIVETAYPFTLDWADYTNNFVGLEEHLISNYPATEDGQALFLATIDSLCLDHKQSLGWCYWGAEWVAYDGDRSSNGSAGENLALFNFNFNMTKAAKQFKYK